MGFRINTNVPAIAAQRTLGLNTTKQASTLGKLSSGSRIVRSADDAAGLAISEKLKASIRSTNQANRNASDGISLIQTAEGGLNETSNLLIRMRELAMQSASDTVGERERQFTDLEYQNLVQEIERISQVTEFNGKKLLNGSGDNYDFQIGIGNDETYDRITYNSEITDASTEALEISSLSVNNKEDARSSLAVIDNAISNVSGQRAELGAVQNRLTSTIQNLQVSAENLSAANSRIRDADYAKESAENTRLNILTQAGTSVLSQANTSAMAALKLLG